MSVDSEWNIIWNEVESVVNLEEALDRWGDKDFFVKALVDFIDDYAPMMDAIQGCLNSGKLEKAVTLKGIRVTKGAREAIEAAGGKVEE